MLHLNHIDHRTLLMSNNNPIAQPLTGFCIFGSGP